MYFLISLTHGIIAQRVIINLNIKYKSCKHKYYYLIKKPSGWLETTNVSNSTGC